MKTNFVLIMCDQQLREHLGSYGSRYGVTPNLDRLAGEGVVFENAYTACPVCTPARGAVSPPINGHCSPRELNGGGNWSALEPISTWWTEKNNEHKRHDLR